MRNQDDQRGDRSRRPGGERSRQKTDQKPASKPQRPPARLGVEDVEALLQSERKDLDRLFEQADRARRENCGDSVHIFGLVRFSNHREKNLGFGGIRTDAYDREKYRMEPDEIVETVRGIRSANVETIVLESLDDPGFDTQKLASVIQRVKEDGDIHLVVSVGEKSREDYVRLQQAGVDRVLLNRVTTNWILFNALHPGVKMEERNSCIQFIVEAGFPLWTGGIAGLPGQSPLSIAEDLISYAQMKADLVNVLPFLPVPETPLARSHGAGLGLSLKALASARVVNPSALIPVSPPYEAVHQDAWRLTLGVGANVIVVDLTPREHQLKYAPVPERVAENPVSLLKKAAEEILAVGRKVAPTLRPPIANR